MPLAASFTELHAALHHLERVLKHLLWAIVQGQPPDQDGHALVDQYERLATDAGADAEEALAAAARGRAACARRQDLAAARQALIMCQDRVNRISERYCAELADRERLAGLDRLTRQRGAWQGWAAGVRDALGPFPAALHEVSQAAFRCWQDLTESAVARADSRTRPAPVHTAQPSGAGARSTGSGAIVPGAAPGG